MDHPLFERRQLTSCAKAQSLQRQISLSAKMTAVQTEELHRQLLRIHLMSALGDCGSWKRRN
jgi:hypothetical protein